MRIRTDNIGNGLPSHITNTVPDTIAICAAMTKKWSLRARFNRLYRLVRRTNQGDARFVQHFDSIGTATI